MVKISSQKFVLSSVSSLQYSQGDTRFLGAMCRPGFQNRVFGTDFGLKLGSWEQINCVSGAEN